MCGKQPLVFCAAKAERTGWRQDQSYLQLDGQDPNCLHRWVGEWFWSRAGVPKGALQVIIIAHSENAWCQDYCPHGISPYPRAQKTIKGEFQVAKRLLGPDFPSCEKFMLNHWIPVFSSSRAIEALALEERCKPNTKLLSDSHGCEILRLSQNYGCLIHDRPEWGIWIQSVSDQGMPPSLQLPPKQRRSFTGRALLRNRQRQSPLPKPRFCQRQSHHLSQSNRSRSNHQSAKERRSNFPCALWEGSTLLLNLFCPWELFWHLQVERNTCGACAWNRACDT